MLGAKHGVSSTSAVELSVACGEALAVHRFSVQEAVSELFSVQVLARSASASIDLREIVGQPAALTLHDVSRRWSGVCSRARLVEAVEVGDGEVGLSTYELTLVPWLWWLTQRTAYRIFQRRSAYEVVREVLDEWGFGPEVTWRIDDAQHPRRPYLVQYGETDFLFVSRLLEEAGIAYGFSDDGTEGTQLVLSDRLHESAPRRTPALVHVERPAERVLREFATRVSIAEEVRPESVVLRDHDFRRPTWALRGEARRGSRGAGEVERYAPGAFLVERGGGGAVHEDQYGAALAARALESARTGGCLVRFETNAIDLRPGTIITLEGHPREELGASAPLLVTAIRIEGSRQGDWTARAEAVPASMPYRPPQRTPRPKVAGVQSATVIGPPGQEIHTDEHGRVQVQFPWDREEQGSCWLRVAQGWAGAGLGLFALPRVGQEVLVGFLEGDPDQPVVVGRLSNALNPPPLKLPDEKTQSVWRTASSPGGRGYSEIRFEDEEGAEILAMRAERDLGIAVRRDRAETVGGDETIRVEGRRVLFVGQDAHVTTAGEHRERVGGARSLTVDGDRHERVGGVAALGAGAVYIQAAGTVVIEGADVTLRGPGGFVRIDGGGVTIDGGAVRIQQGGAPGEAQGAAPELPLVPQRVDARGPGPRRLPLVSFPGLPPGQVFIPKGKGGPLTQDEMTLCTVICSCRRDPAPMRKPQDCVTFRLRAMEEASGHTSRIKSEVPYDMTTTPPTPIMSRNDPRRATRRRPPGSKIPDVVIVKDGTRPPTQDNIEKVIEIKFPPDSLRVGQERYDHIAGKAPFEVFDPERCRCSDRRQKEPEQVTVDALAEAALLTLLVVVLILDDALPGGQADDVAIPPAIARILSRLAPLLGEAAPVLP